MNSVTIPLRICDNPQKLKYFIKGFFSECDQICSFLRIWSHLLKKSLMENFLVSILHSVVRLVITFPFSPLNHFSYVWPGNCLHWFGCCFNFRVTVKFKVLTTLFEMSYHLAVRFRKLLKLLRQFKVFVER